MREMLLPLRVNRVGASAPGLPAPDALASPEQPLEESSDRTAPTDGARENVDNRVFPNVVLEFAENCLPFLWRNASGSRSLTPIVTGVPDEARPDHAKGDWRVRDVFRPDGQDQ